MIKEKKAFTLIELLVTIVLFSLLLATALYSFRFISINIRNINNTNPQDAMNYNLLRDIFSSTYYYIDTDSQKIEGKSRYYYYFNGNKRVCRFISNASLFYDNLVVVQLTFKESKLIYEEGKIFSKDINYKNIDSIPLTRKITILKMIKDFEFIYEKDRKKESSFSKEIPNIIQINFKKNTRKYSYIFTVKATNSIQLKTIIRDYNLRFSVLKGGA